MTATEVSIQMCKVFLAVKSSHDFWTTSREVAKQADVSERTARSHLLRLAKSGVLEQIAVFPGYRYRMSAKTDKPSRAMLQRINDACEAFGLI